MPLVPPELLQELQRRPECIRNVCVLAHVDHGKTTFSDRLLAANGIISQKTSGKIRYLDSREDEQERGITMKSSAVSLYFKLVAEGEDERECLINLIDSPGHVDFGWEVSSAARVCDGALCLVDVLEGVCTQTHAVLRQAWTERLRVVLVLNKMDRLVVEARLTPLEAFEHLRKLLENVNSIMGGFFREEQAERELEGDSETPAFSEQDIYFDPARGNVVFASALDGWAFRPAQFARMYAVKLGVNAAALERVLWSDACFDPRTKRVVPAPKSGADGPRLKPVFVQFVLENLWAVYDAAVLRPDAERLQRIVSTLGVRMTPRELRSKDTRGVAQEVLGQWLPLPRAVLLAVLSQLPSPSSAQAFRLPSLVPTLKSCSDERLSQALLECEAGDAPMAAFVAKLFSVAPSQIHARDGSTVETTGQVMLGFARVFSGLLKAGDTVFVMDAKGSTAREVRVSAVYLLMGRDVVEVDAVPAGNVCGVGGIDGEVRKTATLSSSAACPSFGALRSHAAPILRVAVEPEDPGELRQLVHGLRLLNQADPVVEVTVQPSGEHVIACLGELHLERCLRDLRDTFARIELNVSEPLVPFRETISVVANDAAATVDSQTRLVRVENDACVVCIRAFRVPDAVERVLDEAVGQQALAAAATAAAAALRAGRGLGQLYDTPAGQSLLERLPEGFLHGKLAATGPRASDAGTCLLLVGLEKVGDPTELASAMEQLRLDAAGPETSHAHAVLAAFELACAAGPLCAEPISGVAFVLESLQIRACDDRDKGGDADAEYARISGKVMAAVKEAVHQSMLAWSPRLALAMYRVRVWTSSETLGRVYAVVSQRRGRVVSEEMKEGTNLFEVVALVPVIESLGLAEDLRKRTSGDAQPELAFCGFSVLDQDPFWVPTTQEELEDLGEKADRANVAKTYVERVRRRKGLATDAVVVPHPEKQKTLKNK